MYSPNDGFIALKVNQASYVNALISLRLIVFTRASKRRAVFARERWLAGCSSLAGIVCKRLNLS